VPPDGGSIGNTSLRRSLRWSKDRYVRARQVLIEADRLRLGRGRGGSVRRALLDEPPAPARAPTPAREDRPVARSLGRLAAPPRVANAMAMTPAERTIHRVRQRFLTSCGVAVVAMLAAREHDEVLAAMFPKARRKRVFYTNYKDIIPALDLFNVSHGDRSRRVKRWDQIPTTSIVLVKSGVKAWHWVILRVKPGGKSYVLDPYPGRAGTQRLSPLEQAGYPPVSYLTVEPIRPLPQPV